MLLLARWALPAASKPFRALSALPFAPSPQIYPGVQLHQLQRCLRKRTPFPPYSPLHLPHGAFVPRAVRV